MYFGFRFLYFMAAGLYFLAFVWEVWPWKSEQTVTAAVGVRTHATTTGD